MVYDQLVGRNQLENFPSIRSLPRIPRRALENLPHLARQLKGCPPMYLDGAKDLLVFRWKEFVSEENISLKTWTAQVSRAAVDSIRAILWERPPLWAIQHPDRHKCIRGGYSEDDRAGLRLMSGLGRIYLGKYNRDRSQKQIAVGVEGKEGDKYRRWEWQSNRVYETLAYSWKTY